MKIRLKNNSPHTTPPHQHNSLHYIESNYVKCFDVCRSSSGDVSFKNKGSRCDGESCGLWFFKCILGLYFLGFLIVFSGEGGDTVVSLSSGNAHSGRIYS